MEFVLKAIDAAITLNLPAGFLLNALGREQRTLTPQAENKMASEVREHLLSSHFRSIISAMSNIIPKSVTDMAPELKRYRDDLVEGMEGLRANIHKEAISWAKKVLDETPELAARICESEPGLAQMRAASDIHFNARKGAGSKRLDRSQEKFAASMAHKIPRIAERINEIGCHEDEEECARIAIEEVYGGVRGLMLYTLAMQYGLMVAYYLLASSGAPQEGLELAGELIGVDDDDFRISVAEHSKALEFIYPECLIIAYGDRSIAHALSFACGRHFHAVTFLAMSMEKTAAAQLREKKEWQKTEKELRDKITKLEQDRARLDRKQDGAPTNALAAEITMLKEENARLRNELHRKEAKLERMSASMKDKAPQVDQKGVEPEAAPVVVAPPPEPQLSMEEALTLLNGKRGILIGGHTIFHSKVKALMPGWGFYNAEETSVSDGILRGAEVVVFFTQYCSHKLTEKALRACRQQNTPVIYANKVNPPAFVMEVARKAQEIFR